MYFWGSAANGQNGVMIDRAVDRSEQKGEGPGQDLDGQVYESKAVGGAVVSGDQGQGLCVQACVPHTEKSA